MSSDWTTHNAWRTMPERELGAWFTQHVSAALKQQGCKVELLKPKDKAGNAGGPQLRVLTPSGITLQVHTLAMRQFGDMVFSGRQLQTHPTCWVAVGHLAPEQPMTTLLLPSCFWQAATTDERAARDPKTVLEALSRTPHRLKLNQRQLSKWSGDYALSLRASTLCQASGAWLDNRFLRTVLHDGFIFGSDRQRSTQLKAAKLSPLQQLVAMEVAHTELYGPLRYDEIASLCESLHPTFRWQSHSEGPLTMCARILYLLDRSGKNLAWFQRAWLLAELSQD